MKKLVGVFATIALLGSGAALANDDKNKPQQDPAAAQGGSGQAGSSMQQDPAMQEPAAQDPAAQDPAIGGSGSSTSDPAMGGSGSAMGSQSAMGQKEVTGKVVKADNKTVWIDMQGAVVPLKVSKSTQFSGDPNVKRAKDLQPGQEIRASLEVKDTDNLATSITPMSGTGGSGSGDAMSPDSSINQGTGMEDDKSMDTGGSGSMGSDPATGGSSDPGTMNPDTGSSASPAPDTH